MMLKLGFCVLISTLSLMAVLTVNPGEIFSVMPAHIDAAYHSAHALLIVKENNILFNASPYYEYPMAHLLQSILCLLLGLDLLILHKILTILLCLFLFIIIFSNTKWLLSRLLTNCSRENTVLLPALIITTLYFTIYMQFSLTYSPQLYALVLLVCFLNYCMRIYDPHLMNKCKILVPVILTIALVFAHHLTSLSLLIIATIMILTREKSIVWKLVLISIIMHLVYRCIYTLTIGFNLLETLNVYELINTIKYHGYEVIGRKPSYTYSRTYFIILQLLCYIKRIILFLFSIISVYNLVNYVKRQTSPQLLRKLSTFWLKTLISLIIATSPVITIAFERPLIFSGIILTLAYATCLKTKLAKKHFYILSITLLLTSFISNIIPRVQNDILSPTGNLTEEYESVADSFLASRLANAKPLPSIFTDLHNYHILKFMLILYNKTNTLRISGIHNDWCDYVTLLNYINSSVILLIHKRTIMRLHQFAGINVNAYWDLYELETLYSSLYSNIVCKPHPLWG